MAFFKTKEEKEIKKQEREQKIAERNKKYESTLSFMGKTLQPIGQIPAETIVNLRLDSEKEELKIVQNKTEITLPYQRIISFRLEDETTLAKSGSGLGGAIVGGALFGTAGAIVGQNMKKGKTKTRWIGTLTYKDKEGNTQGLNFIQWGLTSAYDGEKKYYSASLFENKVNEITGRYGDNITEL